MEGATAAAAKSIVPVNRLIRGNLMGRREGCSAIVALATSLLCSTPAAAAPCDLQSMVAVTIYDSAIFLATPAKRNSHEWAFRRLRLRPERVAPSQVHIKPSGAQAWVVCRNGFESAFDLTQVSTLIRDANQQRASV